MQKSTGAENQGNRNPLLRRLRQSERDRRQCRGMSLLFRSAGRGPGRTAEGLGRRLAVGITEDALELVPVHIRAQHFTGHASQALYGRALLHGSTPLEPVGNGLSALFAQGVGQFLQATRSVNGEPHCGVFRGRVHTHQDTRRVSFLQSRREHAGNQRVSHMS